MDLLTVLIGITMALTAVVWTLNTIRTAAQQQLTLADGSPTIDEYVTRPMLAMSQTCAQLCCRIYGRLEDLPKALTDGLDGLRFDCVLTSSDHAAVCALVYYPDAVIVVWRGTNMTNRRQVRAIRRCDLTVFDARIKGQVHSGLMDLFSGLRQPLMNAVLPHAHAGRKIYVTGHSQGGGLASLTCAAIRIRASMIDLASTPVSNANGSAPSDGHLKTAAMPTSAGMSLITFGSMRAGDDAFASYVEAGLLYDPVTGRFGIQRFRNNNDIVPLVPPFGFGYRHSGRELYIWPGGMVTVNPCTTLKLLQHLKPIAEGIIGDGIADHAMAEYERRLLALRIPARKSNS